MTPAAYAENLIRAHAEKHTAGKVTIRSLRNKAGFYHAAVTVTTPERVEQYEAYTDFSAVGMSLEKTTALEPLELFA